MKKILGLTVMAVIIFASCESKKTDTAAAATSKGSGYMLDSSANVELIRKMNYAFPAGDSAAVFACYNDTAKVHDNLHVVTIKQNFSDFKAMMDKGLTLKVDRINAIFEAVHNTPFPGDITSHVNAWVTLTAQRGGKSVTVIMNQVFAMKDGKISEEWDTYDTAGLMDLMK